MVLLVSRSRDCGEPIFSKLEHPRTAWRMLKPLDMPLVDKIIQL